MRTEAVGHPLKTSGVVWAGALLLWILTEYVVVHFQIARHLHSVSSMSFYYRPLMVTLPLAIGYTSCRRLEKVLNLDGLENREHVSRGMGSITLISYLTLVAALIDLS